ncbi:TPA: DUF262 domain-containing protein [Photobacterium damselae]
MKNTLEFEGQEALDSSTVAHPMSPDTTVRIAKDQYSVFEFLRNETRGRVVLAPDFQRSDVWNNSDRSELIESVLLGIPIPLIYLFEDENGVRQVIDGKQRITALKKFTNNEFRLSNLKMLGNLNHKSFSEIDPYLQAKIEDYQLHTYVIQPPTPEYVKFNIFDRVNRSGIRLNKQEMRHALYQGPATDLLIELSNNNLFKLATNNGINSKRMRDRYLVLRFISFLLYRMHLLPDYKYKSDIDDFLAYVMKAINSGAISSNILEYVHDCFVTSLYNIYTILGADAFRFSPKGGGNKRPINMGLFEMLMFAFKDNDYTRKENQDIIIEEIESRKSDIDEQGLFSGIVDSTEYVKLRFDIAEEIISGINDVE